MTAGAVRPQTLTRNIDGGRLLESFLVAAVSALLAIRFYLEATGFPQVGGGGLHIAHLLWGGLGMLVALVMLLAFLGRGAQHAAALIGGAGFGAFIDELGKFITSDNNYFFRPTIALIYVIFIALFLSFRVLERRVGFTPAERLANAIDLFKEAATRPLTSVEQERVLTLLQQSDLANPLVTPLVELTRTLVARPPTKQTWLGQVTSAPRRAVRRLVRWRRFRALIIGGFVLYALGEAGQWLAALSSDIGFEQARPQPWTVEWGGALASTLVTLLIIVGVIRLRHSSRAGFQWFRRAMLVSIFLVQVCSFYSEELIAVIGLAVDIVILSGLDYLLSSDIPASPRAQNAVLGG